MKRTFLALILSLFSMTFVYAYDFAVANDDGVMIYYNRSGTNATVTYQTTSYNSYSGDVAVPNEVVYNETTYVVTSIGNNAFLNCSGLTSITIPNSVISIGTYAFSECSSLKNVVLEDGATTLSFGTSSNSDAHVFENCPIESLYIGRNIYYASNSVGIGINLRWYYYSPFSNKTTLTSLTIGNLVTSIGNYAFEGCSELTSLTIPNSVTSIGAYAFSGCSGLKNVVLENATEALSFATNTNNSQSVFENCPIESLYMGRNITCGFYSPFTKKTTLTSTTIGNLVTSIGQYTFQNCSGLTSITIPNSITSIGSYAFEGCSGLTGTLTIPNSVKSIGSYAFYGCSRLTGTLTIPNSITSIESFTFQNCSGLTGILTIPNSVTSIGSSAFSGCSGLKNIVIEDGSEILSFGTSYYDYSDKAFDNCPIESLYLGRNISYFETESPFKVITTLKLLTIGNLVTSIGGSAFSGCSMMKELYVNNPTPITVSTNTFPDNIRTIKTYIPHESFAAYFTTDVWKEMYLIGRDNAGMLYNLTQIHAEEGGSIITVNSKDSEFVISPMGANIIVSLKNGAANYHILANGIDISADFQANTTTFSPLNINHIYTYQFNTNYKFVIHVDNSGTLIDLISIPNVNNVKELIVSGNLNGTDILTIRKLTNLVSLDMTNANIVSGGESYYQTYTTSTNTIGDYFFKDKTNLAIVKLPNTVTSIGSYTFDGCIHLKSILIPNSVTHIRSYAFSVCSELASLAIPNSVISIGNSAFLGCRELTSLTIPNSVTSIGSSAFQNCSGLTGTLTIPNSVISIGNSAFSGCYGLKNIVLEDGTATLSFSSDKDFENCPIEGLYLGRDIINSPFKDKTTLTSITIGSTVTSIGSSAFLNCSGLTSITIPNSVISIGNSAFSGCSKLKNIVLEDGTGTLSFGTTSNTDSYVFANCPIESLYMGRNISYNYYYLYNYYYYSPFRDKPTLTSITIGNSVTSIGNSAFSGCNGLTGTLTIPNSVISIGSSAFSMCSGLASLTIGNSVTSIGVEAFYFCSGLTILTIPNSVTSIENGAFSSCGGLRSVVLEDGTTTLSLNGYAFWLCPIESLYLGRNTSYYYPEYSPGSPFSGKTTLTSLTIGSYVTSIGNYAFYGCFGLTGALTIPNSVTSIGNAAFSNCFGLTGTLTIPNSVTSIGDTAFEECSGITGTLIIPNSVISIGNHAFQNCRKITSLIIPNSITSIGNNTFQNCSDLTSVTIPNSVTSIGNSAFSGCSALSILTIGNQVKTIGNSAFADCINLMEINSKNSTPPKAESNTFEGVDKKECILYVPISCTTIYWLHPVWEDFFNIQEKDFGTTSINNIVSATEISAYITDNGIKINGCNPLDKINIYTATGQMIYGSVIGDGFVSYPFKKGMVYIIHTPKKSLKVVY